MRLVIKVYLILLLVFGRNFLFVHAANCTNGIAPLPEGNNGIAALYPSDADIQFHKDVLFVDGFEDYTSLRQLSKNWEYYYQKPNTRIANEAGNVFFGNRSLEFTQPQGNSEVANAVVKTISPPQDTLFVRVYCMFETGFAVTGQGHNGIRISSPNYPGPGHVPNGLDFFLLSLENSSYYLENQPGFTHVYVYYPEQRSKWGDHWYPDGKILPFDRIPGNFGAYFVSRQNFIPETGRWYSYEFMVKANTPKQRNGRIAAWIDGTLIFDFQNVRIRDISTLKIGQIQLELDAQNSKVRANRKWYDNLVVAKSYIGPMSLGARPRKIPKSISW